MPATEYLRPDLPLVEGAEYVYASDVPAKCRGHRYRLLRQVLDVPSYTRRVLVECLSGPDAGLLFVCTPWNFSTRYKLPPDPAPPDKAAGALEGRGA